MSEALSYSLEAGVAVLRMDDGKVNALSHPMIDGLDVRLHDPLQHSEINHEPAFRINRPFHRDADPVIVSVKRLALVPRQRNEVRGREAQVFLRD